MNHQTMRIMQPPPVTYLLHVTPTFVIHCTGKVPNRFHRAMLKLVFGFRVEPVSLA